VIYKEVELQQAIAGIALASVNPLMESRLIRLAQDMPLNYQ
jgi:hypothetical protein